ncbi:ABC transporter substrate-binding protein [Microlunatus ginsengisoli]|uniref:ABC transporter substrate-binding protein n=1 Tax=Microlunatus ginsengisoli TaxID=363863 RepID=UPI0031D4004F
MNRRQFLLGGLAAAATTIGLVGCAPGSGSSGGGASSGGGDLTFAWWGNDVRNKNTTSAIDAYKQANPGVSISPQPGEWASYWDKLATQVAGNTAPDIIQMDMAYISEYGNRGALLDLSGVNTSKFVDGTVESGKINDTLYGVNAGINTVTIMANPKVFEKAGMDLPDDTTWTWDSLIDTAAEVASKAKLTFGAASLFNSDAMFSAYLRQNGKQLFTAQGLGFEAGDAQAWFDLMVKGQKAGAIGTPAQLTEEATKSLDQSTLAVGTGAMQTYWSNQVEALNKAAGTELKILRFPSLAGKATERKAWYKASMLWSASARTKNPDAVVALIDWWVNSTESANINLAERGVPANGDIQSAITPKLSGAQQGVLKFINDIKPELSDTPIAPPPGGGKLGDVMLRYQTEVLFGRQSTADAAQKFVDEMKSNLQG